MSATTAETAPAQDPAPDRAATRPPSLADRLLVVLVRATSFVGAGLLFMVEPMIAKLVLPVFGGSPSVRNTAIFFFQVCLLGGYLLTHLTVRRLGIGRQMWLQVVVVLLPLAVLPIALPQGSPSRAGRLAGLSHHLQAPRPGPGARKHRPLPRPGRPDQGGRRGR